MSNLSCLVLMPFNAHRTFVYELAIKKAIEELNEDLLAHCAPPLVPKLELQKADEVFAPNNDKVKHIKQLIADSDLVIVDISELNPNVLWELGYSTAQSKYVILIGDESDLPFNLRVTEICKYNLNYEGMSRLREDLVRCLREVTRFAIKQKESLIRHKDFLTASRHVTSTLKRIREDSLLTQLALNELTRIGTRFEKLAHGLFELRNVKPYEEVIEYYCEYVSQLDGESSKFDVVSNLNFWKEITLNGRDIRYILANAHAAARGANIQRVILVDASKFNNRSVKGDELYTYILKTLYNKQKDNERNFQTRLYFSDHFDTVRETYNNFGILTKGSEVLLFEPQYEGNRMKETTFIYINNQSECADWQLLRIKRFESLFSEAWGRGEMLSEKHFV